MLPHHFGKPGPVSHAPAGSACASTPEPTGGPYPYDLSGNGATTRRATHENRPGRPLPSRPAALRSFRIDLWHCDADGCYSECQEPGYLATRDFATQTFCRGILQVF